MGLDADGLPIGLQLVARPFAEGLLLRVATAFDRAVGFSTRRPPFPGRGSLPAAAVVGRLSPELRGILISCWRCSCSGSMVSAQQISERAHPTSQIIWLRFVFTIPLALLVGPRGPPGGALGRPWLQSCAAAALVEIGLVVWCFGRMPLADVHSVLALTPLAVTALAVPLLGRPAPARRWAAVGGGPRAS